MQRRIEDDKIYLKFGYNPNFSNALKKYCGAKWQSETNEWMFDNRFEDKSNDLLLHYYGCSYRSDEKIRVEFKPTDFYDTNSGIVKIKNLMMVWRDSRDADVNLNSNTIIIKGNFPKSGGSTRYPTVFDSLDDIDDSIVLETILYKEFYDTLSNLDKSKIVITKYFNSHNQPDKNKLIDKKQELLNQIAEIDAQLNNL